MSRANPIGLRLTSKTLNSPFLGIGQYYSYDQFIFNIAIYKSIKQFRKQLVVPTYRIPQYRHDKKNTKNQILYPSILPINVGLKAKQLFDSQYALNRRRCYCVAVYITILLKQQFEKNYKNLFGSNSPNCEVFNHRSTMQSVVGLSKQHVRKKRERSFCKYKTWKANKSEPGFTSLCASLTFAQTLFRMSKLSNKLNQGITKYSNTSAREKYRLNQKGDKNLYLKKAKEVEGRLLVKRRFFRFFFLLSKSLKVHSDPYLLRSYGKYVFFKHLTSIRFNKSHNYRGKSLITRKSWQKSLSFIISLKKKKNQKTQKKKTYCKAKKRASSSVCKDYYMTLSKHRVFKIPKEFNSKPPIDYQIIKRSILLRNLLSTLPINCSLQRIQPTFEVFDAEPIITSFALAKEVENKQKPLYINSVSVNKNEVVSQKVMAHKISYTLCPGPLMALHFKTTKKLVKYIEHFRSDIKQLAPIHTVFHRSFSEPVGINCISIIDNRLGLRYCNQFSKNLVFQRTSNSYLQSSYIHSRTALLRAKNTILFNFAYTTDVLIKLSLKKKNLATIQQLLDTGHTKLWLRKLSSVRV